MFPELPCRSEPNLLSVALSLGNTTLPGFLPFASLSHRPSPLLDISTTEGAALFPRNV